MNLRRGNARDSGKQGVSLWPTGGFLAGSCLSELWLDFLSTEKRRLHLLSGSWACAGPALAQLVGLTGNTLACSLTHQAILFLSFPAEIPMADLLGALVSHGQKEQSRTNSHGKIKAEESSGIQLLLEISGGKTCQGTLLASRELFSKFNDTSNRIPTRIFTFPFCMSLYDTLRI